MIQWRYSTTFADISGNSHDATPSFRLATSDANVTAALVSFQPIAQAQAPDFVLSEAVPFVDSSSLTSNVTSAFTIVPPSGSFPLAGVISDIATATSTPAQLPLVFIAGFVILIVSLAASAIIRERGSGSVIAKIVAISATMGIFVALGNFGIDFWMIFVFLVIGVAMAMASRQLGWN
jgi:hypothetical protein